jgi:hypothetical protein
VEKDKIAGYRSALGLSNAALPAVIFFDKSGKQVVRVVAAKSAMIRYAQLQRTVT